MSGHCFCTKCSGLLGSIERSMGARVLNTKAQAMPTTCSNMPCVARRIKVQHGFDVPVDGVPSQVIAAGPALTEVGLSGVDYPGLRPALRVAQGDQVALGQTLFVDRHRPDIAFTAPISGRVDGIQMGPKRTLEFVAIAPEGDLSCFPEPSGSAVAFLSSGAGEQEEPCFKPPPTLCADTARSLLLTSGLWPAFRSRPFGFIPRSPEQPRGRFCDRDGHRASGARCFRGAG